MSGRLRRLFALSTGLVMGIAVMGKAASGLTYPKTQHDEQTDAYHGTKVDDPFRWLEDTDSARTKAWVTEQNKVTREYLEAIPGLEHIKKRLTDLWNYERCDVPHKRGSRLFFQKNTGLQNQSVLYVQDSAKSVPRVLLDPNPLSKDGTVSLTDYTVSDDSKLMAYGLAASGSDWQTWHVRDVESCKDTTDVIEWVKHSRAAWTKDGKGFFYSRYDAPKKGEELLQANYYQKVFYHKLGTPQSADKLIFERKDQKEWGFMPIVTDDGKYLVLDVWLGTSPKNGVFYKDLTQPDSPVKQLFLPDVAMHEFVGNVGTTFYFNNDTDNPRGRLVSVDVSASKIEMKEIFGQTKDTLTSISLMNNKFIATYLKDAYTAVKIYSMDGTFETDFSLPGVGTAHGFGGDQEDKETYFSFTSFNTPPVIYHVDLTNYSRDVFFQPKTKFNPSDYTIEQIFYKSKDGTKIPMFICHRKDVQPNGKVPTYLYGYGGFKISMLPAFSPSTLLWMELGGVFAQANLRGGGEYGEDWHEAGMKRNKQKVFDDFIGAAEALTSNNYTNPEKLAIGGGSNGGLLVGACITQRPELYRAAVPAVGVMDMLRFHKFTVGWAWVQEYGSPDDEDDFKVLYKYSPLHNLKKGTCYPATLVVTADHDDRVVPGHSFKFAAAIQEAQGCDRPCLIRIETRAGHGAGKSTEKIIEETADKWAFLTKELGLPVSSSENSKK